MQVNHSGAPTPTAMAFHLLQGVAVAFTVACLFASMVRPLETSERGPSVAGIQTVEVEIAVLDPHT